MKILLSGCFFISLAPLAQNFAISVNKQAILIPLTASAVFFGLGLDWWMLKSGYGINGVALGTSVAYFVYFAALFSYTLSHCEKARDIAVFLAKVSFPLFYAVCAAVAIDRIVSESSMMFSAIIKSMIFYLAYLPMLLYVEKKTKVLSRLFNNVFRKHLLDENELAAEKVMVDEGVEI